MAPTVPAFVLPVESVNALHGHHWPNLPGVWVPGEPILASDLEQASGRSREDLEALIEEAQAPIVAIEVEPPPPEPDERVVELLKNDRTRLNELATEAGVTEPDKLPNKEAVAEAIVTATAPQEA